jgi:dCTP diphosphatase
MSGDALEELAVRLRRFADERDWGQFHSPKNLAMALSGEVGELVEIFQWLTEEESLEVMSSARADDVRDELADVLIYLIRLADVLGVDLAAAATAKIGRNEGRFPAASGHDRRGADGT